MNRQDPGWLRVWWPALLLAVPLLAFGVPETLALIWPGTGGTLSEWTRDALGVADGAPTARFWAFLAGWAALAVWFPVHLLQRWPWERRRRTDVSD